jgi:hypothetical protein
MHGDPRNAVLPVRKYNQRMAQRMARRAHVREQGVAVCFAYNNLATTLVVGTVEDKQLAAYSRHAGVVKLGSPNPGKFSRFIRRGQLTFDDGHVVYHGILWIRRAKYIAQEANRSARW